ncbi:MAG: hypothetical protein VX426_07475 [Chloroflexota bacterium]|nr:hypothetical protein [Chloroflexota bacterium]
MAGQTGNGERSHLDRKGDILCSQEGKIEFSTAGLKNYLLHHVFGA